MMFLQTRGKKNASAKGSLLILTLWIFVVLTVFALSVGYQVRQRLRFIQTLEIREKLRLIADSGVHDAAAIVSRLKGRSVGLYQSPLMDPAVFQRVQVGDGFYRISYEDPKTGKVFYGIQDENRKLSLNSLKSPRELKLLIREVAGTGDQEASDLAAAILDWKDPDDVLNAGGAESRYYRTLRVPYQAKNARYDDLAELRFVKGMRDGLLDKLRPYLTIAGFKRTNINTAPPEVLMAKGVGEILVGQLLRFRAGRDGIPGTRDDGVFERLESAPDVLDGEVGLSPGELASFRDFLQSGVFGVDATHYSVRSTAHLRGRSEILTVDCILTIKGRPLVCHERFGRTEGLSAATGEGRNSRK